MATIVNMFWHGSELPAYARSCMRSFIDRGHIVRLFAYQPFDVPAGAIQADAAAVLHARELQRYHSIASFADAFRYELLFNEGGWWADVDVVCLTDRLPDEPYAWAEQTPGVINSAILKFPKADPILAQLAARARKLSNSKKWGATGPDLLSDILQGRAPLGRAGSTAAFYPLHWLEAPLLLLPEFHSDIERRIKSAMFLHLWSHVFEEIGIDLSRDAPRGSFMYEFAKPDLVNRATLWTQVKTRHAIKKYWRQSWVLDRWSEVFGQLGIRRPVVRYLPY